MSNLHDLCRSFQPTQAASVVPIVFVAHYVSRMKLVPQTYKRACLLSAYVAFLYHGMQRPCVHKGFRGSYSTDSLVCCDEEEDGGHTHGHTHDFIHRLRRAMRYVDLSCACFMPSYLALHDRVSPNVLAGVCALSGLSQPSTSLTIASAFLLCIRRYYKIELGKRFIAAFLIGSTAFGNCPRDKWIHPHRYIWHFCVSQSVMLSAHLIRGNRHISGMAG